MQPSISDVPFTDLMTSQQRDGKLHFIVKHTHKEACSEFAKFSVIAIVFIFYLPLGVIIYFGS